MAASPPATVRATMRSEWRGNWRTGVAVIFSTAFGYTVWPAVSSLFVGPLQQTFGWTRGQIALTYYALFVAALCAPLIGRIVDRIGARRVLLTALALVASGYLLLAALPRSLIFYYSVSLLLAVTGMATSSVVTTKLISRAFRDTRGSALAIARAGLAVAVFVLPTLLYAIMARWGFRAGFLTLAGLILLIALPAGWRWIPRHQTAGSRTPTLASQSVPELLKNPRVGLLCLAAALNYAPVLAILSQLKPLAEAKGLSSEVAIFAVSLMGIAAFAGALLSGFLIDRLWAPGVAFALNVAAAAGCCGLFLHAPSASLFLACVLLIGIGQGAEIDIVAFIVARWFGLRSYGTIYGMTALCISIFASVGAIWIAAAYDRYGSYQLPLGVCGASFVLAALLYLTMGSAPADGSRTSTGVDASDD